MGRKRKQESSEDSGLTTTGSTRHLSLTAVMAQHYRKSGDTWRMNVEVHQEAMRLAADRLSGRQVVVETWAAVQNDERTEYCGVEMRLRRAAGKSLRACFVQRPGGEWVLLFPDGMSHDHHFEIVDALRA